MKANRYLSYFIATSAAIFLVVSTGNLETAGAKTFPALASPAGAGDKGHNAEGIKHYNKGAWGKAELHFREAVKTDGDLAEAHYNLALALDKLRRHGEATKFFASALKLAPDNPDIAGSKILKDHLR
ncbi:MAG: tetratricopeptide repeat protein [Nitrospiria bacterium]